MQIFRKFVEIRRTGHIEQEECRQYYWGSRLGFTIRIEAFHGIEQFVHSPAKTKSTI